MKNLRNKRFGMSFLLLQVMFWGVTGSAAQTSNRSAILTAGMQNPELYSFIHDGRFNRVENNLRLKMAFENYVTAFSASCGEELSKDRVEITKYVANYRTQTTFLPWGKGLPMPITTQVLESEGYVGTGIYAEPEFARVYSGLTAGYLLEGLKKAKVRTVNGLFEAVVTGVGDMIVIALETNSDMNVLLSTNGCRGEATKTFSANLLRFFQGRQSLQASNGEKSYFEKECIGKLSKLFPNSKPSVACPCIYREMSVALPAKYLFALEDNFDLHDFRYFLVNAVYRSGLHGKVSSCVRAK
ncbi:MAG: hypothetical protein IPL32_03420 [Chloracidobacterium sp.]|nr:hypothetical protein [Chloracidobacterium sp.]